MQRHAKLVIVALLLVVFAGVGSLGWYIYVEYYMPPYERRVRKEHAFLRSADPKELTETQSRIAAKLSGHWSSLPEAAVDVVAGDDVRLFQEFDPQIRKHSWANTAPGQCHGSIYIKSANTIARDYDLGWKYRYFEDGYLPSIKERKEVFELWEKIEEELDNAEAAGSFPLLFDEFGIDFETDFYNIRLLALIVDCLDDRGNESDFPRLFRIQEIYLKANVAPTPMRFGLDSVWNMRLYMAYQNLGCRSSKLGEYFIRPSSLEDMFDAQLYIGIRQVFPGDVFVEMFPVIFDSYGYTSVAGWVESRYKMVHEAYSHWLTARDWVIANGSLLDSSIARRFLDEVGLRDSDLNFWLGQYEQNAYKFAMKHPDAVDAESESHLLSDIFSYIYENNEFAIYWNQDHPIVAAAQMSSDEIVRVKSSS